MKHVAVLMGGMSAEREVSLTSGKAVVKALESLGKYKVSELDAGADISQKLSSPRPDVVFNALHGTYGEDGCVQGLLEILGIPYTHSGVLASALAMNKPLAKEIFAANGIPVAKSEVMEFGDVLNKKFQPDINFPIVVKPVDDGSSVGVAIINEEKDISSLDYNNSDIVMVEEYISGREIQVAVLEDEALGAIEIIPNEGFYDYEAKYTDGKAKHIMPAPLDDKQYEEVLSLGLLAHKSLGCRGLTRSDFRYNDYEGGDKKFYILETNTQPGMTPLSLAPEIAAYRGIDFASLVQRLVETAKIGN